MVPWPHFVERHYSRAAGTLHAAARRQHPVPGCCAAGQDAELGRLAMTSRLEVHDVVQEPDAATPVGAPAARLPAPERRLVYRAAILRGNQRRDAPQADPVAPEDRDARCQRRIG